MKISPLNIKRQEFSRRIRGYDKEEVDAFLTRLADEFENLQSENDTLTKELENAKEKLSEFRRIEKNLQDTLLKAQENSSKSIESTKKQATLMVKEAEVKASQILEKARENANEIRTAVIHLRDERDLIVSKLKSIIHSQAQLVELKLSSGEEAPDAEQFNFESKKKLDLDIDDIVKKLL
ncbi:MAG: DivIVA domain-containing protein [Bacteroidetes bacterium]|nr:DivIVA domain-containing protein [Bacteroidota bacterium]MCH8326037.1 DivIVA domain-containing protein [Bacteroidota bacterium]